MLALLLLSVELPCLVPMTYVEAVEHYASPSTIILRCNYCSNEFPSCHPHFTLDNDTHIEMECSRKMAEKWLKVSGNDFYGLSWLKELEQKYYSKLRRKRTCYLNKQVRLDILKKYKFTCVTCKSKENLSIDHIHPVSKGGSDEFKNLQVMCRSCNSRKSNRV